MKVGDLYSLKELAIKQLRPDREYDERLANEQADEAEVERKVNAMSNMEMLELLSKLLISFNQEV